MGTIRFDIEEINVIKKSIDESIIDVTDRYCTIRIAWFYIDNEEIGKSFDIFLIIKRTEEGIYYLQPSIMIDERELMKAGKDNDILYNTFKGTAIEQTKNFNNIKDITEYTKKVLTSDLCKLVSRKLIETYKILYGNNIKEDL